MNDNRQAHPFNQNFYNALAQLKEAAIHPIMVKPGFTISLIEQIPWWIHPHEQKPHWLGAIQQKYTATWNQQLQQHTEALHFVPLSQRLLYLRGPTPRQRGTCCCWQRGGWTRQAPRRWLCLHGRPGDWAWRRRRSLPCVDLWRRDVVLGVLQLLQLLHDLRHRRPHLTIIANALQGNSSDSVSTFLWVLPTQLRVHDAVETALVAQVGFRPVDEVLLRYRFWFV